MNFNIQKLKTRLRRAEAQFLTKAHQVIVFITKTKKRLRMAKKWQKRQNAKNKKKTQKKEAIFSLLFLLISKTNQRPHQTPDKIQRKKNDKRQPFKNIK